MRHDEQISSAEGYGGNHVSTEPSQLISVLPPIRVSSFQFRDQTSDQTEKNDDYSRSSEPTLTYESEAISFHPMSHARRSDSRVVIDRRSLERREQMAEIIANAGAGVGDQTFDDRISSGRSSENNIQLKAERVRSRDLQMSSEDLPLITSKSFHQFRKRRFSFLAFLTLQCSIYVR